MLVVHLHLLLLLLEFVEGGQQLIRQKLSSENLLVDLVLALVVAFKRPLVESALLFVDGVLALVVLLLLGDQERAIADESAQIAKVVGRTNIFKVERRYAVLTRWRRNHIEVVEGEVAVDEAVVFWSLA